MMPPITRPTLLLDETLCRRNIRQMSERVKAAGCRFRPHFKTHQSRAIGEWFRDEGVEAITVSSMAMAEYFADAGWNDITLAVPFNPCDHPAINQLASRIRITLITGSAAAVETLGARLESPVSLYIKYDAGNHRSGVQPDDHRSIAAILKSTHAFPHFQLKGFLGHAGNSYRSQTEAEILAVQQRSLEVAGQLRQRWQEEIPDLQISLGDTPCCSVASQWPGVDELRPGNFVFYDLMQMSIGSCTQSRIAVCMACPVVDVHAEEGKIIIHGGAIHFSKDASRLNNESGDFIFGLVAERTQDHWEVSPDTAWLSSLSQEHGVISTGVLIASRYQPGDVIHILPIHSCLTADCMGGYLTLEGKRLDHFHSSSGFLR